MKRIARAKSKTVKLLLAKLEAQADGPVTEEYLKLADLLAMMMGVEFRYYHRNGPGRPPSPPKPEDTRSYRERLLDGMTPEKRKQMKAIWEAEDAAARARQAQQAQQAQEGETKS